MNLNEIMNIPINENEENLVNVSDKGIKIQIDVQHYLHFMNKEHLLRENVIQKLIKANKNLPKGYELIVLDAYRTPTQQESKHRYYIEQLKNQYYHLTNEQINKEANIFTAIPIGHPPHTTGAAVNTSLLYNNKLVDMGSFYESNDSRNETDTTFLINKQQQHNRHILRDTMEQADFVNNPLKWWHYSYGDQAWASTKNTNAIYGKIENVTKKSFEKLINNT